jgi:hypothetical protein
MDLGGATQVSGRLRLRVPGANFETTDDVLIERRGSSPTAADVAADLWLRVRRDTRSMCGSRPTTRHQG